MEDDFRKFITLNANNLKAEFYIPFVVNNLIVSDKAKVKVLTSESSWFGVTYKEDKNETINRIKSLVDEGKYPSKLW